MARALLAVHRSFSHASEWGEPYRIDFTTDLVSGNWNQLGVTTADELGAADVLERERQGRRNVYSIHAKRPLRHPVESHCTVEGLIRFVLDSKP